MMRTPNWWRQRDLVARLLMPLGWLYMRVTQLRQHTMPERAPIPVICVGNAVAGGAGKTPVVLGLVGLLNELGEVPHLLSRGYGGQKGKHTPHMVTIADDASQVGDEALLLAQEAPCWVSPHRVASAHAAAAAGASVVVMDDGWQSPHLRKDISLLVVDGQYGIGNGYGLPAGPLRETWGDALARADAVVLLGEDRQRLLAQAIVPVWRAELVAVEAERWASARVVAFAGIGRPEKFFATLRQIGADLVGEVGFADHHPYTTAELEALAAQAVEQQATLITTTKDWMRLPPPWRNRVEKLAVRCVWAEEAALRAFLEVRLLHAR